MTLISKFAAKVRLEDLKADAKLGLRVVDAVHGCRKACRRLSENLGENGMRRLKEGSA